MTRAVGSAVVTMRTIAILGALLLSQLLAGCASLGGGAQPAPLLHLVYFELDDPQLVDGLRADCDRLLAGIPSVVSYASGRHLDVGRDNVDSGYDLFLLVGFADERGYGDYLAHPQHVQLVDEWRPHLRSLRIHDVWTRADR